MSNYSDAVQNDKRYYDAETGDYPIKVVALGGLDEMGKNCYVIEINNDAFIIEAGIKYPTDKIPGIDVIIPDFDYLRNIAKRVKAIIITHGHDDQYGALPYLLNVVHAPIYATETTITIIQATFGKRFKKIEQAEFITVNPSDSLDIAGHHFELFQTTHSVAESFGFALATRFGNIVYTSDFMSDYSPVKGYQFDLPKVARLSESSKTFLLMTESESADKPGIASPSHKITSHIRSAFEDSVGKIFISIYNQNFYNIQEVINLAVKFKKKICIPDKEMADFIAKVQKIGQLVIPSDMMIYPEQIGSLPSKDVVILLCNSGEKLFSYIKDVCYGSIPGIKVETKDLWINASPSVPGTETISTEAADTVFRTDCHVITLDRKVVNAMHAKQEDLKMMISLFRPKYYLPVKGEYRLLMSNAKLAIDLNIGLTHFNTFVFDNGMVLAFDENGKPVRKPINVKNGDIMVDGNSVGDVNADAIRERNDMANGGVVLIGMAISLKELKTVSNPDIQMRGFLYLKDSESIVNSISNIVIGATTNFLTKSEKKMSIVEMENKLAHKVLDFIRDETGKDPIILVKLVNVDEINPIDPK